MNAATQDKLAFLVIQAAAECCLPQPQFYEGALTVSGLGMHSVVSAVMGKITVEIYVPEETEVNQFAIESNEVVGNWHINVILGNQGWIISIIELIDTLQSIKDQYGF